MRWYLFPFSIIYRLIIYVRNKLFDFEIRKSKSFPIPIISVGNISVGGTGKTPHTEFLIEWLMQNYNVSTLSRGYGRKTRGFIEVNTNSEVKDVGDEALQVKQKFPKVKVVVDEKRVNGVNMLIKENNESQIVILDDAFQHRSINAGLNILLIDYNKLITKDFLLPVGRLREPAHNRKRADIIILTKCPKELKPINFRIMLKELSIFPYQYLFFTSISYSNLIPVFGKSKPLQQISKLKGKTVVCVTGIANPQTLYNELEEAKANIVKMPFTDHHNYTKSNIDKIISKYNSIETSDKIILCTEKDAVKFKEKFKNSPIAEIPFYYVPINVKFLNNKEKKFKEVVSKFVKSFY